MVAFTLDEAAGGSTSVIQVYRRDNGTFSLTGEGGHEMNNCDMHILLLGSHTGERRLFAFGTIFGANQAISKGVLYAIRDQKVIPVWKKKDSLGLEASLSGGRLVLEYRDAQKFYQHTFPDAFHDMYVQTDTGFELVSRKPLEPDRQ